MGEFDFISVLISLIIGLGITNLLSGAGRAFPIFNCAFGVCFPSSLLVIAQRFSAGLAAPPLNESWKDDRILPCLRTG
jgi:hypothetical protein